MSSCRRHISQRADDGIYEGQRERIPEFDLDQRPVGRFGAMTVRYNPYRRVRMPAEAIPVVIFICCTFAVAIGAIAYAQSTAPKDVTRQ